MIVYANTFPGYATYSSPGARVTWYIWPGPARATRPRPVIFELPRCAKLIPRFMVGDTDNVWPVHARRPFLCVIIQSSVPFRCITDIDVIGDFVEMSTVIGVVEETR